MQIQPGYTPSEEPREWVLPHHVHFSPWVNQMFDRISSKGKATCPLFEHQKFIRDFIGSTDSPYRGILLYHGLGTGKTITSIAAAEALAREKEIVVMLPASIVRNYMNEIVECGNSFFAYSKQKWRFVPDTTANEDVIQHVQSLGVKKSFTKKIKGVWTFDETGKPFDKLDAEEQSQIIEQTDDMIRKRYHFVHYNGITIEKIKEYGRRFFENKTVVIDEIHNFISSVKNGSRIRRILYDMLMQTENVKIIGLSGTPVINDLYEIAFMMNLLHGYMDTYYTYFATNAFFHRNLDHMKHFLSRHKYIDDFDIQPSLGLIKLVSVPSSFARVSPQSHNVVKEDDDDQKGRKEQIESVIEELVFRYNIRFKHMQLHRSLLLPEDPNLFNKYFIQDNDAVFEVVKNKNLLMRRLQSVISYFEAQNFPDITIHDEYVKMSDKIFEKYEVVREKERQNENKAKFRKQPSEEEPQVSLNIYRAFSRALCLFCFPDEIPRVYPSDLRKMAREMDNGGGGEDKETEINMNQKSEYEQRKTQMMKSLHKHASRYLTGEGLETYGPKYQKVIENIKKSPGPVLIYSHFREIEGLGIMKEVLDVHGYAMMDVVKKNGRWTLEYTETEDDKPFYIVFTQNKVKNQILMSIFNSEFTFLPDHVADQISAIQKKRKVSNNIHGDLIKMMMVTQSGSEGITLKNVRQVHILEPYWNPIRIKQVIGRAVRINSHKQLPPKERSVDVYKYIMTFDQQKLEEDKNKTSDEFIDQIATRKARQMQEIQVLLQKTAVDCDIHKGNHPHIKECFHVPKNYGKFAYTYDDITTDMTDDVLQNKIQKKKTNKTVKAMTNAKSGKKVYYIEETKDVIENAAYENKGAIKVIGKLHVSNTGKLVPMYYT